MIDIKRYYEVLVIISKKLTVQVVVAYAITISC